jgi:hypothetical protein
MSDSEFSGNMTKKENLLFICVVIPNTGGFSIEIDTKTGTKDLKGSKFRIFSQKNYFICFYRFVFALFFLFFP